MTSATFTAANISAHQELGSVIRNFEADDTGAVGDAVYITSAGKVKLADANVDASPLVAMAVGIVVAVSDIYGGTGFVAGNRVSVCVFGPVWGFSSLVEGTIVYASKTPGDIEQTIPTAAYQWAIGYAIADDCLFVHPGIAAPVSA